MRHLYYSKQLPFAQSFRCVSIAAGAIFACGGQGPSCFCHFVARERNKVTETLLDLLCKRKSCVCHFLRSTSAKTINENSRTFCATHSRCGNTYWRFRTGRPDLKRAF